MEVQDEVTRGEWKATIATRNSIAKATSQVLCGHEPGPDSSG